MNLHVDIGHPAHVHFFKGFLGECRKRGERVLVTTRDKEITNALLDRLDLPYVPLSKPRRTRPGQAVELVYRWIRIWHLLGREKIDVSLSISGLFTGLPARLRGLPNLNFTDTEDARLSNRLAFPFATRIYTPAYYLRDEGTRHRRYGALHELAYLRHYPLADLPSRLKALGMPERYVVVRLVANDALHDVGVEGIPVARVAELLPLLNGVGQVFVTSQGPLPEHLRPLSLRTPIDRVHDVLAGATLFVGESPTMAVESSLLGTPSYLLSTRCHRLGNMVGLAREGMLRTFERFEDLVAALRSAAEAPVDEKARWRERARRYREASDDVARVIREAVADVTGTALP